MGTGWLYSGDLTPSKELHAVTRPVSSIKPDNFFLLLFHAIRQRRMPIVLRIVLTTLILVALSLSIYIWMVGMQFRHAMQEQADAIGNSFAEQAAASATNLLVTNDILSINILLSGLAKNPLVSYAAVYSTDNKLLAEAGSRPDREGLIDGSYSQPILFQEVKTGELRLNLNMERFQQPFTISLNNMAILALILLAVTLFFTLRLGYSLTTPLLQLRVWFDDQGEQVPALDRNDEIGDLARQVEYFIGTEEPEENATEHDFTPEPYPGICPPGREREVPPLRAETGEIPIFSEEDLEEFSAISHSSSRHRFSSEDDDNIHDDSSLQEPTLTIPPVRSVKSAVLAVRLGAQEQLRQLPRHKLLKLLQRYRDYLDKAVQLYHGKLFTLEDGSSLALFHGREDNGEDYLTNALCCGELMRALGHELQIEVADSGMVVYLQLGLAQGENLVGLGQAGLQQNPTTQSAQSLSLHSRNLLLVAQSISSDVFISRRARIRPIVNPVDASCVERLQEPYASLLERQIVRLQQPL